MPVLNPRDSSGHGEKKKSQFRDLIAQFSSSQRLTKMFKSIPVSREWGGVFMLVTPVTRVAEAEEFLQLQCEVHLES